MIRRVSVLLAITLLCASAPSQTLEVLLTNGPTASRINIVFLSEGYTQSEFGKFRTNATAILDHFLSTPPFNDYENYFNAFAISVASQESGSDHPSTNFYRNTYFNSTYDSFGTPRLVSIPPNNYDGSYANGRGKVDALLAGMMPEYDVVVLVVNDTAYGGSGGEPLIASINTSSAEIAIHELGHNYAGLGDEYSDPYPGYPDIEEPNTTRQTNRAQIKWRAWIADATPVPTPATAPYSSVIGLFEGAHYHSTGWYRPKFDCKMHHLDQPFCAVCAEALVTSTYEMIRPIESVTPPTNSTYTMIDTQSVTLGVRTLQPASPFIVQWHLNDQAVPNATNATWTLSGSALPLGTNRVRVVAADTTARVRTDPTHLLTDSRTWKLIVQATRPSLRVQYLGTNVALSWPALSESFVLESKSQLSGSSAWQTVPGSAVRVDDWLFATNSIGNGSSFYRLRRQ